MREPALAEMARRRLANQQITVREHKTPRDVVCALGAVQAQDYRGALWAVGLRSPGSSETDIERAVAEATIVRTWAMRGTLHLVAATDIRWILELLAPRIIAAGASRRRQLEIDEKTLASSRDLLIDALSHGRRLPRDEAMVLLESAGIRTGGQRGIHLLWHLSLEGLICQASPEGRQSTFALLGDWVPSARLMGREEALAELAVRYVGGHGPATFRDFVWWSGLTVADAKTGIELARGLLARETLGDKEYLVLPGTPPCREVSRSVFLLPGFDEYVLGYADRGVALDAVSAQRIVPGGNGIFRPTIVEDGRVVGTWKPASRAHPASVVDLFGPLGSVASDALSLVLREYADFVSPPSGRERRAVGGG